MFYVASVITFRIFLELLRKSNLIVNYRFNCFQPPRVNQFGICALLFGGYVRFIQLDKMIYIDNENLTSGRSSMSQLVLKLFLLCYGLLL